MQPARAGRRWAAALGLAVVPSASQPGASAATGRLPTFSATALTGQSVSDADLRGEPTILILTPSKDAAADTRRWAEALQRELNAEVRVLDILAIDLPFFMSESDALGRARETIPARYHDQTWLMSSRTLETALGVAPRSRHAHVFVLDAKGRVVQRVSGAPTRARVTALLAAARALRK